MIAVWAWMKKYWEYLVAVGLLFLGIFFGLWIKRTPVIVQGGKTPEQKKVEDETVKKTEKIVREAEEKKVELKVEHAKEIQDVVDKQKALEPSLTKDPDATNAFLKEVGRSVRGDSDGGQP
jgi:hypothetical protein